MQGREEYYVENVPTKLKPQERRQGTTAEDIISVRGVTKNCRKMKLLMATHHVPVAGKRTGRKRKNSTPEERKRDLEILKVKLDEGAHLPERAFPDDAGYDIRTPIMAYLPAHGSTVIDSGVHMQIPKGYVGILKSKSGLNVKHDIVGTGTIDSGYTGSIRVKLYNHGERDYFFNPGDKIIQIVIYPIITPELEVVDELEETERSDAGFGSTGK